MRITSANATPIDIRLNDTVSTGAGSIGDRGGIRVTIHAEGVIGLGETAPIPGHVGPKLEQLASELSDWCKAQVDRDIEDSLGQLDSSNLSRLSRFAAHTALIDIQARSKDAPMSQWLRSGAATRVRVNGLVSESSPAAVHSRTLHLVEQGMTAIKLKVGHVDHSLDITRIVAASEAAGSRAELRLDVNGAWTAETVTRIIGRVGRHRIAYIEDPTNNSAEYVKLAEETGVPVAIDLSPDVDPDTAIADAGVTIVVVKPAALGGVDKVIALARQLPDHQIVVSSSIQREVGLSAAVHCAAALPMAASGPHGLATGRLIRNMDPSLLDSNGEVRVPAGPGVWNTPAGDDA